MFRLHLHRLRTPLCGLLAVLLLAGCGEEPTPPRLIGFTPPVLAVPANETLEISVAYEDQDARLEDFQWRVEAGEIEGNGTPTVTYRAPEQPGDYAIAVTAAYGEDGTALTLDGVVQVTQASQPGRRWLRRPRPSRNPRREASGQRHRNRLPELAKACRRRRRPAIRSRAPRRGGRAGRGQHARRGDRPSATDAGGGDGRRPEGEAAATAPTPGQETSEGAEPDQAAEAPGTDGGRRARGTPEEGAAAAAGSRLDRILERRRLIALVQIAFEPFSFYGEDGRRSGFEIDFLREFAKRWLDDPSAVTYLPVPSDARIPTLQRGRADLIAAALTRTPERAEQVDFSLTYFEDGQRLLVPRPQRSPTYAISRAGRSRSPKARPVSTTSGRQPPTAASSSGTIWSPSVGTPTPCRPAGRRGRCLHQ